MAYTSLYRKYRPDSFDKVIGQDHIVRTLQNQILRDSVGHAYIFTGTRGTGKTSVAKIFARSVNCKHKKADGSACGECEVCKELALPTSFDILELDAASNNSVDQIRELIEKINYPPLVAKYKVYIIDEVHMLSKAAFNALLKTLEEPPAHAIFILATTEIHQVPSTILSRCLRFDFRLVPMQQIAAHICHIFDDIGAKYEKEAVDLIAAAGNGSVRDALSIADMCVSYCMDNISYDGVLEVLGAASPQRLQELALHIAQGNIDAALESVASLCDLGKSVPTLAQDLATLFRNVIYIQNCKNARQMLRLPESVYAGLKQIADVCPTSKCLAIQRTMSSLEGDFRYSTQHRIILESGVVLACTGADPDSKMDELAMRVSRMEKYLARLKKSGFERTPVNLDARQVWNKVASELVEKGYQLLAIAATEAEIEQREDKVVVKLNSQSTYDMFVSRQNCDIVNRIFERYCKDKQLVFELTVRLDEDKALPYLQDMFGAHLQIK